MYESTFPTPNDSLLYMSRPHRTTTAYTAIPLSQHPDPSSLKPSAPPAHPAFSHRDARRRYAAISLAIAGIQVLALILLARTHPHLLRSPAPVVGHAVVTSPLPLPRFHAATVDGALHLLDYVGTVSFARSGALLAAAAGMDLLGAVAVGTVTALGGGSIRDAFILARRPFWTDETEYLYLAAAAALVAFLAHGHIHQSATTATVHNLIDAFGVGAFAVIGAQSALQLHLPYVVCAICGVSTATFGGVFRDVFCKRDIRIFHSTAEIYASAAAAAACFYLVATSLQCDPVIAVGGGVFLAVVLRVCASYCGLRLPVWHWSQRCVLDDVQKGKPTSQ